MKKNKPNENGVQEMTKKNTPFQQNQISRS